MFSYSILMSHSIKLAKDSKVENCSKKTNFIKSHRNWRGNLEFCQ